jgi:hypothetical protein
MFARGEFAEAYSAFTKVRAIEPALAEQQDLVLNTFLAAFNAHMDHAAIAECDRIRQQFRGSWPAAACSAMAVGWASAEYDLSQFVDAALVNDAPRSRAENKPVIAALVAAARARASGRPIALPSETYSDTTDADLMAMRVLERAANGDTTAAVALRDHLTALSAGPLVLNSYHRMFEELN